MWTEVCTHPVALRSAQSWRSKSSLAPLYVHPSAKWGVLWTGCGPHGSLCPFCSEFPPALGHGNGCFSAEAHMSPLGLGHISYVVCLDSHLSYISACLAPKTPTRTPALFVVRSPYSYLAPKPNFPSSCPAWNWPLASIITLGGPCDPWT